MCLRTLRRIWGEKSCLKSLSLCKMRRRMLLRLRLRPRRLLSISLLVLNLHHRNPVPHVLATRASLAQSLLLSPLVPARALVVRLSPTGLFRVLNVLRPLRRLLNILLSLRLLSSAQSLTRRPLALPRLQQASRTTPTTPTTSRTTTPSATSLSMLRTKRRPRSSAISSQRAIP